jgi:hypothetical protein
VVWLLRVEKDVNYGQRLLERCRRGQFEPAQRPNKERNKAFFLRKMKGSDWSGTLNVEAGRSHYLEC